MLRGMLGAWHVAAILRHWGRNRQAGQPGQRRAGCCGRASRMRALALVCQAGVLSKPAGAVALAPLPALLATDIASIGLPQAVRLCWAAG